MAISTSCRGLRLRHQRVVAGFTVVAPLEAMVLQGPVAHLEGFPVPFEPGQLRARTQGLHQARGYASRGAQIQHPQGNIEGKEA